MLSLRINKLTFSTGIRALSTMKKSNVYTRTGDKGKTSLYNGDRKFKTDKTFDVLGHIDHLNSQIGMAKEMCILDIQKVSVLLTCTFSKFICI